MLQHPRPTTSPTLRSIPPLLTNVSQGGMLPLSTSLALSQMTQLTLAPSLSCWCFMPMLVRSVDYLHSPEMSNSKGPNEQNKTRARRESPKWICRGVTQQEISTGGGGSKSDPADEPTARRSEKRARFQKDGPMQTKSWLCSKWDMRYCSAN